MFSVNASVNDFRDIDNPGRRIFRFFFDLKIERGKWSVEEERREDVRSFTKGNRFYVAVSSWLLERDRKRDQLDFRWCVKVGINKVKKMPVFNNLLDLDINKVFQDHTIKEIEQIQKKLQNESERKKVELRTLVGSVLFFF